MFRALFLIALVPALVYGNVSRACTNGRPQPTNVIIEGCTAPPCDLVRGQDVVAFIDFTTDRAVTSMTTVATATALGVTTNYPLGPNAVTCNFLQGSSCPLSANEDVTYRLTMPILAIYPLVSLSIEIDIVGQDNISVACFVVDAQVVTATKLDRAVTSMTTVATATALGVTTNYPLGPNAVTCNFLQGSSCPLSANEDVTYRLTMPILAIYPLVSLSIEIDIVGQDNISVACFVVDAQVVTATK
uniref:MD-2-related lipid-recognition domain-containing protein n=1 Tax=Anopheles epiroticus TaxID=199890 RepID=A0A182P285_9DIPT